VKHDGATDTVKVVTQVFLGILMVNSQSTCDELCCMLHGCLSRLCRVLAKANCCLDVCHVCDEFLLSKLLIRGGCGVGVGVWVWVWVGVGGCGCGCE